MSDRVLRLAVVVLAAGAGHRFGGVKQLAKVRGISLLQRIVSQCNGLNDVPVFVVLGAWRERIEAEVAFERAEILHNREWKEGIASSIRIAAKQLGMQFDALLFVAADQVAITTVHLEQLANTWRSQPTHIVCAKYRGDVGVPAIYPAAYFPDLLGLHGDSGGKKLLSSYSRQLVTVDLPLAAIDVDTLSDLAAAADSIWQ